MENMLLNDEIDNKNHLLRFPSSDTQENYTKLPGSFGLSGSGLSFAQEVQSKAITPN